MVIKNKHIKNKNKKNKNIYLWEGAFPLWTYGAKNA